MINWLKKELVIAMHERQLAEHGGSPGVRDESLLESALARPQQRYAYGDPAPDLADLAASLAFGLARNHPFVDGNKRTVASACETFLELNHVVLEASDPELFPQYLALAEGRLSEQDFAAWLRQHIRSAPRGNVHEPRRTYKPKAKTAKPQSKQPRRARAS